MKRLQGASFALALAVSTLPAGPSRCGESETPFAALLAAGERHYREGRYQEALDAFEAALAEAPPGEAPRVRGYVGLALANLGFESLARGETSEAESRFARALEMGAEFYARLGLAYIAFLRLEDGKARDHAHAALARSTKDARPEDIARIRKLLAFLEYRSGRFEEALAEIERAAELDPSDREAVSLRDRWRLEATFLGRFIELPSKRFLARADPDLPAEVREWALRALYAAYESVGGFFGLWPRERVPAVLYEETRFHLATGSRHFVGGLYDGQLKLALPKRLDPESSKRLERAIRHEYAHALVRRIAPECPLWLNEGIAQYVEEPRRAAEIAKLLAGDPSRRIGLENIPAQLWGHDDEDFLRRSYLEGLGFVSYLAETFGAYRLRLLLWALREEHSLEQAFRRVYGEDLKSLETRWWADLVEGADR